MASNSKSTTLTNGYGNGFTLTASFNENSTNVVNNTSNITCTATFSSGNANWSTSYASTLTIYWHDNRENYDRQVASINFAGMPANTTRTASGTINVTHFDDGGLSGYAYAYFNKGGTTTAWACNSGGVTTDWTALTKIDRYATMTSAGNFTDMQNPSFTYNNPRNLTMTAWLEVNPVGEHLATRTVTGTSGTYTWELTETERNQLRAKIPNSKTATCRIGIITTISGTSSASYKDVTFTIVEEKPTLNASYEDTNSTTTAITGNNQLIIRNNSTLEIDVTDATAYKEATLSSITAELNGTIYNGTLSSGSATFNIGTINVSDNITAVVTLTDSRGFVGTKNVNIQVLDWELPTAIINLQRENNYYSETNINVDAEYSSLDNKNTITIKARYKKVSDSTYGSYTTLQDNVTTQFTLDNNYAWDVQVLLQDKLGSTTYNLTLDRGIPITYFDRLKRSVGINCFPANATSLEVSGENILTRIAGYGQIANQVTGDWNTACGEASGIYMGNGLTNSPTGSTVAGWWWVIHLVHNATYQRQIAFSFLNNGEVYTRIMNNGTWNSWTPLNNNGTVLWTNPNPNSNFSSQNITLNSSDYDVLEVYSKQTTTNSRLSNTKIIKGYDGIMVTTFDTGVSGRRTATRISDTSYTIGNLQSTSEYVGNNSFIIPLYIIGYKTGLF